MSEAPSRSTSIATVGRNAARTLRRSPQPLQMMLELIGAFFPLESLLDKVSSTGVRFVALGLWFTAVLVEFIWPWVASKAHPRLLVVSFQLHMLYEIGLILFTCGAVRYGASFAWAWSTFVDIFILVGLVAAMTIFQLVTCAWGTSTQLNLLLIFKGVLILLVIYTVQKNYESIADKLQRGEQIIDTGTNPIHDEELKDEESQLAMSTVLSTVVRNSREGADEEKATDRSTSDELKDGESEDKSKSSKVAEDILGRFKSMFIMQAGICIGIMLLVYEEGLSISSKALFQDDCTDKINSKHKCCFRTSEYSNLDVRWNPSFTNMDCEKLYSEFIQSYMLVQAIRSLYCLNIISYGVVGTPLTGGKRDSRSITLFIMVWIFLTWSIAGAKLDSIWFVRSYAGLFACECFNYLTFILALLWAWKFGGKPKSIEPPEEVDLQAKI